MELKEKELPKKSTKAVFSIVLYVAALVVAIIGISSLVISILLFKKTVAQYAAQYASQGYSAAAIAKQLLPSELLPAAFQTIGTYGGITFLLIGAGMINQKLTCLLKAKKDETAPKEVLTEDKERCENTEVKEEAKEETKEEDSQDNK